MTDICGTACKGEAEIANDCTADGVKVLQCSKTKQVTYEVPQATRTRKRRRNQDQPREPDSKSYLHLCDITEEDRFGPVYANLTGRMLFGFASKVYHNLLLKDHPAFRSLLVGCRLDCGIDTNGKGSFVKEITRYYNADKFSLEMQAPPHDRVCKGFANGFNTQFSAAVVPTMPFPQKCPLFRHDALI
jgi:hypothetical protein